MRRLREIKNKSNIKIQFLGANREVTGSCTYLEIDNLKILVDYGGYQDSSKNLKELYKINSTPLPIDISKIDAVCITHGHLDHSNRLGMLKAQGFNGQVITSALTADLLNINLNDAVFVHDKEIKALNKNNKGKQYMPLYTYHSVEWILSRTKGYSFYQSIPLSDNVKVTLIPSGHISGACMFLFEYKEEYTTKRILFTGDTSGLRDIPFTTKPNIPKQSIDYVVTESTYGNRDRIDEDIVQFLIDNIRKTCIEKRGTLVIPSFAIARSTNLLYYLKLAYDKDSKLYDIPIYLASPMACKAHREVLKPTNECFYDDTWNKSMDLDLWEQVEYIERFKDVESRLLNSNPKICIASAGMLMGGYSLYLVSKYITKKKNTILFSGFQGEGTRGRYLLDKQHETITVDGKQLKIKANIDFINGMSSHATGKEICEMLEGFTVVNKCKNIFINHGDEEQSIGMKDILSKVFDKSEIVIPKYQEVFKL